MKTRGKTKVQPEFGKDGSDPREGMDDGNETNGYPEDKANEPTPSRGEARGSRNGGPRRVGRIAKVGAARGKNDKHIMESAEFRDVVQGFFDFIEEINKRKPKPKPNARKPFNKDVKPVKPTEEIEINGRKRVKPNQEGSQTQSNEKIELAPSPNDPAKGDKNSLYRYKEEPIATRELFDIIKGGEKEQPAAFASNLTPVQNQDQKPQLWQKEAEAARQKEAQANKPQYPAGMDTDFNSIDYKLKFLQNANNMREPNAQLLLNQQANKQANPYEFTNNTMLQEIMQRMQLQNFPDQNPLRNYYLPPPFDNYSKLNLDNFNVKPTPELLNLQVIEALLQKNQSNLWGSLLGTQPGAALFGDLSKDLPYMLPSSVNQNQQRFGNQSLGVELIQSEPEAINPKTFEGKLGRAATHVAIAYFIYFKSLDPDTIAKSDKSKMDPTFNARMLKEKKYESFGNESSMVNKLLPTGFESRLPNNLGLGSGFSLQSLDSFSAQDLQRLLAKQGLSEQLREAHIQRLQQELLRNEEPSNVQARGGYQNKNETKVEDKEDKIEAQRRRTNEPKDPAELARSRQVNKQNMPKDEEIINIENSDTEMAAEPTDKPSNTEIKEEKVESQDQKSTVAETKSQPSISEQAARPEAMKPEESNVVNMNAEGVVDAITKLTSSNSDPNKNKPKSVKKVPGQKVFADEGDGSVQTHNAKPDVKAPQTVGQPGVQVISSDEAEQKMQDESTEKKPEPMNTETSVTEVAPGKTQE